MNRAEYKKEVAGSQINGLSEFGYMWECPDFFELGGADVLLVSPQGIEKNGDKYNNLYQTGYFIGDYDWKNNEFNHGDFFEMDRGLNFMLLRQRWMNREEDCCLDGWGCLKWMMNRLKKMDGSTL